MRILLALISGILLFFFIGEIINRLFKKPLHNLAGLLLIIVGTAFGFVGHNFVGKPLDVLFSFFITGAGIGLLAHHLLARSFLISEKFESNFLKRHAVFVDRLIEIMPGALTWIALLSPFWLSITL